jgi:hypothetical protein
MAVIKVLVYVLQQLIGSGFKVRVMTFVMTLTIFSICVVVSLSFIKTYG